jgi:hypothetical protein
MNSQSLTLTSFPNVDKKWVLLLAPWPILLSSYILAQKSYANFSFILLVDIWLLSHPHALSTYLKKDFFKKYSYIHLLLTLLFFAGLYWSIYNLSGNVTIFQIYFYIQWFHYIRQNYGVATQYRKSNSSHLIDKFVFHGLPLLSLSYLFKDGAIQFFGYFISPLWSLESIALVAKPLYLTMSLLWLCHKGWEVLMKRESLFYTLYSFSIFTLYYFIYIYAENFFFAWLALTIFHNMQYLIFNWSSEKEKTQIPNFMSFYFLSLVISLVIYGCIELGEKFFFSYTLPLALIGTFTVNSSHYFFDTLIWKQKRA